VRFLGRRVYWGIVVTLISALNAGLSGYRTATLTESLCVPLLTLRRWRQWWLNDFVQTPLWRGKRVLFMPPVEECRLPACLLPCFPAPDEAGQWVLLLRFLTPLTSATANMPGEGR
jgi:hypothetical protein